MLDYLSPFTGEQVDSAVSAYISGAIANSITAARDSAVATANVYTTVAVSGGVTSANTYTDSQFASAVASASSLASSAGQAANSYTDSKYTSAIASAGTLADSARTSANSYTDSKITSANSYTDSQFTVAVSSAGVLTSNALSSANTYADQRTTLSTVNNAETAVDITVLSGGYLYNYTNPVSTVTVSSCVSNSIGDVVHFTAVSAAITVDLPAGLSVLLEDAISSGNSYDLMVCDNRLIIKEIQKVTQ